MTFRIEFPLSLLQQIVATILFVQQHSQIVHVARQFLRFAFPLADDLTLLLHLFVRIGQFLLQLLLQSDQLVEIVLVLGLQSSLREFQFFGGAFVFQSVNAIVPIIISSVFVFGDSVKERQRNPIEFIETPLRRCVGHSERVPIHIRFGADQLHFQLFRHVLQGTQLVLLHLQVFFQFQTFRNFGLKPLAGYVGR